MEFKAKIVASLDLKALRAALKLKGTHSPMDETWDNT